MTSTKKLKLFIVLFFIGLNCTVATSVGFDHNVDYWTRLTLQVLDINPAIPGPNPVGDKVTITPEIAWDPDQFNPKRIIVMTDEVINHLVGFSDYTTIKTILHDQWGDGFEPIQQNLGSTKVVPTFISVTESRQFKGCSCPSQFEEFRISVLVRDPHLEAGTTAATLHVLPLYFSTDHLKRQESLVHKFSIPEQFAGLPEHVGAPNHIGVVQTADKITGFYLKDQNGKTVFEARHLAGIPQPSTPIALSDYIIYTQKTTAFHFSGDQRLDLFNLDNFVMTPKRFRLQDKHHMMASSSPIYSVESGDTLTYDAASGPGALLQQINFQPIGWTSESFNNGVAWIN